MGSEWELLKKTIFIKNALILTVSSLALRFLGIIFKVWLAKIIGAEGIGLYQLIFSVYVLAATFASSGISTAVTRLTAEETEPLCKKSAVKILLCAGELTLAVSAVTVVLLFFGADFIAARIIKDVRAAAALKILPLSLPFMGLSSCIRGYFIARRKITPNALSQLLEQAARIIITLLLVKKYASHGIGACCTAVIFGDCAAEIISFSVLLLVCRIDTARLKVGMVSGKRRGTLKRILHIAVPITSGRYLNSLLRTAENLLVPKNIAKYPFGGSGALSQFGMIKGMALPILFFPSTLLNAVSTLLIPEISEAEARSRHGLVRTAAENIIKLTSITAFIFAAIFFAGGEKIGLLIYNSREVGELLKLLSPIVPLMYLDSISDGILKGLDQQGFTFRTAVSDSVIRIILILLILPIFGLRGFIAVMYFSNAFTCLLNVGRLIKITGARPRFFKELIIPAVFAAAAALGVNRMLGTFGNINDLVYIILLCGASVAVYGVAVLFFGVITVDEIKNLLRR